MGVKEIGDAEYSVDMPDRPPTRFQSKVTQGGTAVLDASNNNGVCHNAGPFFCPSFADFFALFLVAAQRLSCACRNFSRVSALIVRRFAFFGEALAVLLTDRSGPPFGGVAVAMNYVLACCSSAISASISARMFSSKLLPFHQFYQIVPHVLPARSLEGLVHRAFEPFTIFIRNFEGSPQFRTVSVRKHGIGVCFRILEPLRTCELSR